MKAAFVIPALLATCLAGAVLGETTMPTDESCVMTGPSDAGSEACQTLRAAFRSELDKCVSGLHADTKTLVGGAAPLNSPHAYRARFTKCDVAVRELMGLPSR